MISSREISVQELVSLHLQQIERVNPEVNAICTLVTESAMNQSKAMDQALAQGQRPGLLQGLPIAIKDLTLTKGIRTTFGSPIYKDFVPDTDALFVERLKAAGAIIIGKTNTPEFGAGSHTFNSVFGATHNAYNLTKTAGGSSGGAAVALACGMVPIADGSDLGGSVRNPANFNSVVGLRPSPGRIPRYPRSDAWNTLSVIGPMARCVGDVALMLSAMSGADRRDPTSFSQQPGHFHDDLKAEFGGTRVAWSRDLGLFPVQQTVIEVIESVLSKFEDMGCVVDQAHPDFSGADDIFQTLRAHMYASDHSEELAKHRQRMKDTVVWNIEQGLKLSAQQISRAQSQRTALYHRVREFLDCYAFLLLPVSQVIPFPIEQEWVREIEGIDMKTYIDWMKSCWYITLVELPAISVPCGFTPDGLPVGIQIVGSYRSERQLLRFAHAFEQAVQLTHSHPPVALQAAGSESTGLI